MYADSAANFTLALALTVLFGLLTYLAWRKRGLGALLTGAGITLLPFALWLSHTLSLVSSLVDDVGDWATGLVFSPRVWIGVAVAAVAVVLIGAGRAVSARGGGSTSAPVDPLGSAGGAASLARSSDTGRTTGPPKPGKRSKPAKGGTGDPELDEIEALLRKRGIS